MNRKVTCSVILSLLMGTTTAATPLMAMPIYDQIKSLAPTNQYSTDIITTVNNGTGAINASGDVANYANLNDFTFNGTFSFASNSNSGVNAIFFIGDSTTANNYFTLYAIPSSKKIGVELRNASGSQMLSNSSVTVSDLDFTEEHKISFTMSGNNYYRIYLDGKKILEGTASSGFTNGVIANVNYMGFGVGNRAGGSNNYPMSGNLKDLELYNSALSEDEIISYHLGALENVEYHHGSIYYQDSNVARIQDNDAVSKLVLMDTGSISIRYKVNDQNASRMSLFSISNSEANDKYIDLYVDPSKNIFGLEVKGTKDYVMPSSSLTKANRSVQDTAWHTITITKENGSQKGFMFYLDGVYIDKYTSAVPEGFFSLLADANTVNFGFIDTASDDLEKLSGSIDYVKTYGEVLDLSAIGQEHKLTNWQPGQEIDMTNAIRTADENIYYAGYENSSSYRIPSLLKTSKGTMLAAIDKRITGAQDCGNIDITVRRREANQDSFSDPIVVNDLISNSNNPSSSAFLIDSSMVEDKESGRIYLLADMFPESSGLMDTSQLTTGTGYKEIDGISYLQLFDEQGNEYIVKEKDGIGYVYDSENNQTGYTVILQCDAPYHDRGSLYLNGEYKGNIYMLKDGPEKGELHVLNAQYLWLYYSDDDGKTWSNPIDITPQVKEDWMMFIGTGPGVGVQLDDGSLAFPVYTANKNVGGSQSSAMIISKDGGKTWELGDSPQTNMGNDRATMNNSGKMFTESQAIQLNNGQVKLFMRNTYANKVYVATSSDNGLTWDKVEQIDINEVYCQLSVTNYTRDGKEYVVMTNPDHSPRTQGMVHIGEVNQETGDITWLDSQILNTGKFQYSCLSVLQNDSEDVCFGLMYEDDTDGTFKIKYTEFNDDFIYAGTKTEELKAPQLADYSVQLDGNKIKVALTFDQSLLAIGNPQLKLSLANQTIIANYSEGSGSETITFEGTLPENTNGVIKAIEIIETEGIIENIKNGKVSTLNIPIYDLTEINSGIILDSYTSQHSSSTAENTDGAAINVLDNNPNTYWHSTWGNANINLPQSITLKLDTTKTLYKLGYTPRQNSSNGRIKQYEIETSIDGEDFTSVAQGQWQDSKEVQYVEFVPTDANYIRITAYEAYGSGSKQSCNIAEIDLFEYSEGVIEVGDKTQLSNLVTDIEQMDTSIYAKNTVDNLNSSVNEAKALLDNDLVSQTMLDNAYTKLINAKKALIDVSKALTVIARLNELDENNYTVESWQIFKDELVALEEQLNNVTSSREVLDIVVKGNYIESKLEKVEITETDKTALKIALDKANEITNEDLANVVPVVVEEFKAALKEANEVYANTGATQEEVNNAFNRLASAMQKLEFFKGDKTDLQAFVNKVSNLEQGKYSETSWQAFEVALDKADKVLADENALEIEVNEAYDTLVRAFLDLRLIPNKDLLNDLINKAESLEATNYSADSFKAMQEALASAKAVAANENATQAEVDNAKEVLAKAIASLQANTPATDNKVTSLNNGDTTSVKTGDSANLLGTFGIISSLSVIAYLKKRREE